MYFHGLAGETNRVNIEDGKTLVISTWVQSDANEDGTVWFQFERTVCAVRINGVRDKHAKASVHAVEKADPDDVMQSVLPSGAVSKVLVKKGDGVKETTSCSYRSHEDGDQRGRPCRWRCQRHQGGSRRQWLPVSR